MTAAKTDAIELLLTDHEMVRKLFRRFEKAKGSEKGKIGREILAELHAHSVIEEEIFYPAARRTADQEERSHIAEGYEEHAIIDGLLEELKAMSGDGEQYEAKFTVLIENVEHHVDEEEKELLPEARKQLSAEQRARLGEQMAARKSELLSHGRA